MYFEIIQKYGEPAVDLGCGTGRIILDFLSQGIDIDGVDLSADMLAICAKKARSSGLSPNLYEQSIEALDLPRKYRTILGPSSVLQLVPDVERATSTLRRIFDHLLPGGVFITPFGFAWREGLPLETDWSLHFEKERPSDGATVRSWEREWRDPPAQQWHTEQRLEVELNGVIIETEHHTCSPEGRWYTRAQAVDLYREVGFTNVQVYNGFTFEAVGEKEVELFSVLGMRPA